MRGGKCVPNQSSAIKVAYSIFESLKKKTTSFTKFEKNLQTSFYAVAGIDHPFVKNILEIRRVG